METGQIAALVGGIAMLVILWPIARRLGSSGAPVLRWAVLWAAVLAGVLALYSLVLAPMGVGLR
ncbi:hypothetical protein [Elioraea rosea]|uniref:hypothetical protein n=1 Tax=Elioraea rosea TaxID=2492390 RepID=UPI0011870765|nr:hypothetical protein [Elioraea rosea]